MAEEYMVVGGRTITYSGIFSVQELYDIIYTFLKDKGYDKYDIYHDVHDFEDGTSIEIKSYPERKMTESEKFIIQIFANMSKVKNVDVTINKQKKAMNQGNVEILFKGAIYTDNEGYWSKTGFRLMMRFLADNYVFRSHMHKMKESGRKDLNDLYQLVLDYFNANAHRR